MGAEQRGQAGKSVDSKTIGTAQPTFFTHTNFDTDNLTMMDGAIFVCVSNRTDHSTLLSGAPEPKLSVFTYTKPNLDEGIAKRVQDSLNVWKATTVAGFVSKQGPVKTSYWDSAPEKKWAASAKYLVESSESQAVAADSMLTDNFGYYVTTGEQDYESWRSAVESEKGKESQWIVIP